MITCSDCGQKQSIKCWNCERDMDSKLPGPATKAMLELAKSCEHRRVDTGLAMSFAQLAEAFIAEW